MYPELFEIPLIHLTVKSYGLMMVIGFLAAVTLIRRLSAKITPDPQLITNAALYSLIGGVIGARLFFVIHYFDRFTDRPTEILYIWQGGLELLGGVVLAVAIILFYLIYHKLPIRRYLDILALGLVLALVFGRIGCFLNGCCYGKPTDLPWGVRFPYGSFACVSQTQPDLERGRPEPHLKLPDEYFGYEGKDGLWYTGLKPFEALDEEQKVEVTEGQYRCLPVHPTQLYSSALATLCFTILLLFWRRSQKCEKPGQRRRRFVKPGCTFSLMFVLYGVSRFCIEFLRDDNPFELAGLTISQLIGLGMILLGVGLMISFELLGAVPDES